jgi:hypothetical protein
MHKKLLNVFNFINESNVVDRKLLLTSFYYKYLIFEKRSRIKKTNLTVNNFEDFSKKTIVLPKSYVNKKFISGYSLSLTNYKFKSTKKLNYILNLPTFFKNFFAINSLNSLKFALIKEIPKFILFVSVVKGGFTVYSSTGIKGFLPHSHSKSLFVSIRSKFLRNYFSLKKFSLLWFSPKFLDFQLSVYKRNSRPKSKGRSSFYNFIFLTLDDTKLKQKSNKFKQRKIQKKNVKESSNIKKKTNNFKKK